MGWPFGKPDFVNDLPNPCKLAREYAAQIDLAFIDLNPRAVRETGNNVYRKYLIKKVETSTLP